MLQTEIGVPTYFTTTFLTTDVHTNPTVSTSNVSVTESGTLVLGTTPSYHICSLSTDEITMTAVAPVASADPTPSYIHIMLRRTYNYSWLVFRTAIEDMNNKTLCDPDSAILSWDAPYDIMEKDFGGTHVLPRISTSHSVDIKVDVSDSSGATIRGSIMQMILTSVRSIATPTGRDPTGSSHVTKKFLMR